jgi:tyrosyl-tRNA synthetase
MSKSLGNYIGISEPPKEIYGKLMSINDELMLKYYELLSHISIDELRELKAELNSGTINPKKAKENLALEIVERYWGKEAALKAKEEFDRIFKEKGIPEEIPVFELKWQEEDIWLPKIMKLSGLTKSTTEAIRLIQQGAVSVDDQKITDPQRVLKKGDYLIKAGKRRFLRIIGK